MDDEVIEFTRRRFQVDANWLNGNCYYFAVILRDRFGGTILYDVIDGHFVTEIRGTKYDWSGVVDDSGNHVYRPWDGFEDYDRFRREAIVEGCIN